MYAKILSIYTYFNYETIIYLCQTSERKVVAI